MDCGLSSIKIHQQRCTKEQLYEFFAEFNATEATVKRDVESLKEWLRQQPHLPNVEDTDFLTNFLLRCKNSMEKTKKKLDLYYTTKSEAPEIYQNRDVHSTECEKIILYGLDTSLRKLTPEGYRIIVFRVLEESADFIPDSQSFLRVGQMKMDFTVKTDAIRGMIVILDFKTMTRSHIGMLFSILPKIINFTMKTLPSRFHKFYVLNLNPIAVPLLNLGKSMMTKKIADRFYFWDRDDKELVNVISKDVLPEIYGGNDISLLEQRKLYLEDIRAYNEWFISDEKNKADLSKRPADHQSNDESLFGVDGSFRKIAID